MDELDSALLAHLQRDARQTNRDLAAAVGIAPSTCLERVRALRARGVLTGFHAAVDLHALNRRVQALVAVQVRPLNREVIEGFKGYAAGCRKCSRSTSCPGGTTLLHVAVPDVEAMHGFLMDRLSGRREVIGFNSSVIFQHARNPVVTPLPE